MGRWTALIKPPVALSCAPRSATGGGYHDLCSGRRQLARRREWRRHIDTRVFKRRALRSSPDGADGIRESAQQRRDAETALRAKVKLSLSLPFCWKRLRVLPALSSCIVFLRFLDL